MASEKAWKIKSSSAVVIDGRYRIDFSAPIPALDSPNAQAFAATDSETPEIQLFTLICRTDLAQRHHVIDKQLGSAFENILQPHYSGYVDIDGNVRPCAVFDRPLGGRVLDSLVNGKPVAEPIVTDRILPRIIKALADFEHRGVTHRRIRPENIFFLDTECQYAVLGECFSEPPGFSQPGYFETIDRSMASPVGRGEGTVGVDLYALGVTVATMLRGKDPVAGKSADEIWESKLSLGSFVTLAGNLRISGPTDKLLRGLLNDDPEARWSLDDAEGWVWGNARRLNHMPVAVRASRPLKIGTKMVILDRLAAHELGRLGNVGHEYIKTGGLVTWVRNSLKDKDRATRISELIAAADTGKDFADDMLVTQVCKSLDPEGPIRFRGQAICRDGFGAVVSIAMNIGDKAAQTLLGDLFRSGFLNSWDAKRGEGEGTVSEDVDVSQLQSYMENGAPGFGLERCLYELNTATPCLSPLIVEAGAVNLDEVLRAINAAIGKSPDTAEILDRHTAAFVAARSIDAALEIPKLAVPAGDPAERRLAVLGLFGTMQDVSKCGPLLAMASWMDARIPPVLDLYKSRTRRARLKKEAQAMSSVGDITGMFKVLGSLHTRAEDRIEHREAMREYAELEAKLARIEDGGNVKSTETRALGRRISTILGFMALVASLWFTYAVGY